MPKPCYHNCTTFTKSIQLLKKNLSRHFMFQHCQPMRNHHTEQLQGGNKFRKSVRAVVFNPTCVSIYNLSMISTYFIICFCLVYSQISDPHMARPVSPDLFSMYCSFCDHLCDITVYQYQPGITISFQFYYRIPRRLPLAIKSSHEWL